MGTSSMLHRNCGRQSKHTLDTLIKQKIKNIRNLPVYDTINVSHFKDLLETLHNIKVSYSALYKLLQNNNIKSPRKHKKAKQYGKIMEDTEFKIHYITNMEQANIFLVDYVKKYNKRFGIKAKDENNSFIPLLKSINVDTLLTVKYSRQVDNGATFSYKGIIFKIQNIQILPGPKVELLISKRIGMKIKYKDKLYCIIPRQK